MNQQNIENNFLLLILFIFILWISSMFIIIWLLKGFLDNNSSQINKNFILLQKEISNQSNQNNKKNNDFLNNIEDLVELKDKQLEEKEVFQNKNFIVILDKINNLLGLNKKNVKHFAVLEQHLVKIDSSVQNLINNKKQQHLKKQKDNNFVNIFNKQIKNLTTDKNELTNLMNNHFNILKKGLKQLNKSFDNNNTNELYTQNIKKLKLLSCDNGIFKDLIKKINNIGKEQKNLNANFINLQIKNDKKILKLNKKIDEEIGKNYESSIIKIDNKINNVLKHLNTLKIKSNKNINFNHNYLCNIQDVEHNINIIGYNQGILMSWVERCVCILTNSKNLNDSEIIGKALDEVESNTFKN